MSSTPGTTRDVLEVMLEIGGHKVSMSDLVLINPLNPFENHSTFSDTSSQQSWARDEHTQISMTALCA